MKKRQVSHLPRTRDWLFGQGAELVGVVERRVPHGQSGFSHRSDLYGLADMEAVADGKVWWVQVCSASSRSAHRRKCAESPDLPILLTAGRFLLVSWDKPGHRWRATAHEAIIRDGAVSWEPFPRVGR